MSKEIDSKKDPVSNEETSDKELEPSKILLYKSQDFLNDLDVAREMFETIEPILVEKNKEYKSNVNNTLDSIVSKVETEKTADEESENSIEISSNDLQKLRKEVSRINKAVTMFRQQAIVLLVSKLDEFVTDLLRISLGEKPDKLKSSDKTINYDQIFKYDSINNMIKDIVSDEIDSLMRKSHAVSITFLDEAFKLGIKENISDWESFIEITQRRNLFVHAGGRINNQYMDNCKKYNIDLPNDVEIGSEISVDQEYFQKAFLILFELGVRLSQALYRRLYPEDLDLANTILTEIGFDLMVEERWELADKVFNFAVNIPDNLSGPREDKLRFIINSAICQKRIGDENKFKQLIKSVDWKAYKLIFRLAVSVLNEDFDEAADLMKRTDTEDITEQDYRSWPLFENFRHSDSFKDAYKDKFGVEFQKEIKEEELVEKSEEKLA